LVGGNKMNKKGNTRFIGYIILFGALITFAFYMFIVYIPAITANSYNEDALLNALWWGLILGVVGTIGAVLVKNG